MQIPPLSAVRVELPTTLLLIYADGQIRRFDCAPYLERGIFVRLKEPTLFSQARVAHGTVCWPGEFDIAPETLFVRSRQISQTLAPSH